MWLNGYLLKEENWVQSYLSSLYTYNISDKVAEDFITRRDSPMGSTQTLPNATTSLGITYSFGINSNF